MFLNCFILSSLLFSLFLFCFSNSSRRLEDFPTSPTSTAKQEFLYVGSHVSLNPNRPHDPPLPSSQWLDTNLFFHSAFWTLMSVCDNIYILTCLFSK